MGQQLKFRVCVDTSSGTGTAWRLACRASLAPHSSAGTWSISASRRASVLPSYVRWHRGGSEMSVLPALTSLAACKPKPASSRRTATPVMLPPLLSTHVTRSAAGAAGAAGVAAAPDADAAIECKPGARNRQVGTQQRRGKGSMQLSIDGTASAPCRLMNSLTMRVGDTPRTEKRALPGNCKQRARGGGWAAAAAAAAASSNCGPIASVLHTA
jgi:hypothetical protein